MTHWEISTLHSGATYDGKDVMDDLKAASDAISWTVAILVDVFSCSSWYWVYAGTCELLK